MEQFHVISILGSDAQFLNRSTDLSQARRDLNTKTFRLHARHTLSWLIRGGFILSIFLLGHYVVDGTIGGALVWTSGFLAVYLLWYVSKGHLLIQGDRQAKLYWLKNDAGNTEFSSNDPMVATMPAQDSIKTPRWYGNTA